MKRTLLVCVLILATSSLFAQDKSEKAEQLWYSNVAILKAHFKTAHSVSDKDMHRFTAYYSQVWSSYKMAFFREVVVNNMDNNGVADYFKHMAGQVNSLYIAYQSLLKTNPSSIDDEIKHKKRTHSSYDSCSPVPVNLDFSSGTLNGWSVYYGSNTSSASSWDVTGITGGPCGPVTVAANDPTTNVFSEPSDYQVRIDSTGYDPLLGTLLPLVPPGAKYSCRLGDSTNPYEGVAIVTNQFTLPDSMPYLTCQFAFLLENPTGHTHFEQPFLLMAIIDSTGDTIAAYRVVAQPSVLPGIYYAPSSDSVYYQTWTSYSFLLAKYAGHCITFVAEAGDCALGGHFGYGYISAGLNKGSISTIYPAYCGQPNYSLTAPSHSQVYIWSGPCLTGATNQQVAPIGCAGNYSVVMQDSAHTYSDTLFITVPNLSGPPPKPSFIADTVCAGTPITFTNTSAPDTAGDVFLWEFDSAAGYMSGLPNNPTFTYGNPGIHWVSVVETIDGCSTDTVIAVYDSACTTGLNNIVNNISFTVYPNPTSGITNFELRNTNGEPMEIKVYNVLGQQVYSQSFNIQNSTFKINLSGSPSGMYFYRIISQSGEALASGKLIKD